MWKMLTAAWQYRHFILSSIINDIAFAFREAYWAVKV